MRLRQINFRASFLCQSAVATMVAMNATQRIHTAAQDGNTCAGAFLWASKENPLPCCHSRRVFRGWPAFYLALDGELFRAGSRRRARDSGGMQNAATVENCDPATAACCLIPKPGSRAGIVAGRPFDSDGVFFILPRFYTASSHAMVAGLRCLTTSYGYAGRTMTRSSGRFWT